MEEVQGVWERQLPRPFSLHWGEGQIVEEASYAGQYHEPSIQLLAFEDGGLSLRFCYYNHGRFQRSPLIVSEADLEPLREQLQRCPRLLRLLQRLTA